MICCNRVDKLVYESCIPCSYHCNSMEGNMNEKNAIDYAQPHHRRALEALVHEATSIAGDIAVKGVVNEESERREALRSVMIKMPETRTGQIAFLLQKLPVDEFMSIAEGMGCKWEKLLTWAKQEAPNIK